MKKRFLINPWVISSLVILILVTVLMRLHTLYEPLERDLTTYAVIGHGMLHGKILYVDLWDHKPPLIYLVYGIFDLIFGMNAGMIFVLNIVINVATLLAIYFAVKQLGSKVYAFFAAASWTAISGAMSLQANQPNTEALLNLCLALLVALILSALYGKKQRHFGIWVGLIIAAATLIKYIILAPIFFMLLVFIAFERPFDFKRQFIQLSEILLWTVIPWVVFLGYFLAHHALPAFYSAVIKYNQYYASVENPGLKIHTGILSNIKFLAPSFAIISLVLIVLTVIKRYRPAALLLLFWLALTPLAISLPGRGFPHYYQFYLPVYSVAFGTALYVFNLGKSRYSVYMAGAVASCLIASLLIHQYPNYKLPADEWSFKKYGDYQFPETKKTGIALEYFLEKDETFFQWGDESGLYWYSHKDPITPVLHVTHIAGGPVAPRLRQNISDVFNTKAPELLVVNKNMWQKDHADPLLQEILKRYEPLSDIYSVPGFYILPKINSSFSGRDIWKDLISPLNSN